MYINLIQKIIDVIRGEVDRKVNNIKWNIRKFCKKLFNKPINLVFICHRPNVWGSLNTVFEACNDDSNFNIAIVCIPNKKQLPELGLSHEIYESEGAEEFFKDYPCKVINGYDYKSKKWFNLKQLQPDYVFFQQPYNVCKPKEYSSKRVAKYAKILYVHYAANFIGGGVLEETYPPDFIKDVSTIFVEDKFDEKLVNNYLHKINANTETILTGFPRYDNLEKYRGIDSKNWNFTKNRNIKRIIWTPRWCTNEGNCCFFDYKDDLLDYVEKNRDIDFLFRPHPQAFLEWEATGELSAKEASDYKKRYQNLQNAKVDVRKEYLTTFYSSDIMITDISSIVAEYFLTGKPIIYCHKKDCFNDFSRELSKGFYWVRSWDELEKTINMLKSGEDPLYEKRQHIINNVFYINPKGAGYTIKELIKEDFCGKN